MAIKRNDLSKHNKAEKMFQQTRFYDQHQKKYIPNFINEILNQQQVLYSHIIRIFFINIIYVIINNKKN